MITVCTVVPKSYEVYEKMLLDSIFKFFKLVSKVLIAAPIPVGQEEYEIYSYKEKGIEIYKFGVPCPTELGHPLGLHACIDKVNTDYILFTDPDVFYLSSVDETYLDFKNKYNLDYVGCSHHSSLSNAYSFFPYVMSSLVKKFDLPSADWMKGYIRHRSLYAEDINLDNDHNLTLFDGKYLMPGPIPEFYKKLPNVIPRVLFDTNNSLCLYSIEKDWKWLAFQTYDCHFYSTKYYKTMGLKLKGMLPKQDLLWHSVRSGPDAFQKKYEELIQP